MQIASGNQFRLTLQKREAAMTPSQKLAVEIIATSNTIFLGTKRPKKAALAKYLGMYTIKALCPNLPKIKIGKLFGYRDHFMFIYATKKIEKMMSKDALICDSYEALYRFILDKNAYLIRQINAVLNVNKKGAKS